MKTLHNVLTLLITMLNLAVERLAAARGELAGGGFRINLKGRALAISDATGGSHALTLPAPVDSIGHVSAVVAAQGKLLVVLRDQGHCRKGITVLHTPTGNARDLRALSLPAH